MRRVDEDAVRVPDRFVERDAANDGGGRRVDYGQLVRSLYRHDHAVRAGVVLGVSRFPVELDPRHDSIRRGIKDEILLPRLVRDEHTPLFGRIRDPVRKPRSRYPGHDLERGIVHDHDGVVTSGGGVRPVFGWHGQDASNSGKPVQIGDDSTGAYVEDHELPGAHVRDEQPPGGRLETLIVKAGCAPRQRHVGDEAEGHASRGRHRDGAGPARLDRWAAQCAGGRRSLGCARERKRHECECQHQLSPPYGCETKRGHGRGRWRNAYSAS